MNSTTFRQQQKNKKTKKKQKTSRFKISRVLKSAGIRAQKPAKKPRLADHHKDERLVWCQKHVRWNIQNWSSVLFTDESSFYVHTSDRRQVVYRKSNTRYNQENIVELTNRGYGSVMVWGGIINGRKTPLVRVNGRLTKESYIANILTKQLLHLCRNRRTIFMHDNAPPHQAHLTKTF